MTEKAKQVYEALKVPQRIRAACSRCGDTIWERTGRPAPKERGFDRPGWDEVRCTTCGLDGGWQTGRGDHAEEWDFHGWFTKYPQE
jgi:hypothetical protein